MLLTARHSLNLLLPPPDTWEISSFVLTFHYNGSVSLQKTFCKVRSLNLICFWNDDISYLQRKDHKFSKETYTEKGKGQGFLLPSVNQGKIISLLWFLTVKHHFDKMWKVFTLAYYFLTLGKWLQNIFLTMNNSHKIFCTWQCRIWLTLLLFILTKIKEQHG